MRLRMLGVDVEELGAAGVPRDRLRREFPGQAGRAVPRQCRHRVPPADGGAGAVRRATTSCRGCRACTSGRSATWWMRLRELGADIDCLDNEGFPPLQIHPATLTGVDRVSVRGDVSSQFLTGLLMALPLLDRDVTVEVVGELISKPYIEITLAMMARFGVKVQQRRLAAASRWRRAVAIGRPA